MMKQSSFFLGLIISFFCSTLLSLPTGRFLTDERKVAQDKRFRAAREQTVKRSRYDINDYNNGDESLVGDYAASFSKTMEHDATTGVLTVDGQVGFEQLVVAIKSGKQADYNSLVRTSTASRLLVNPQASAAYSMEGCDSSLVKVPVAPTLSSSWAAAEMLEVYLQAICRDVSFNEYGTGAGTDNNGSGGSLTDDAAKVLEALGLSFKGPRNQSNIVDASVLFRGVSSDDLVGPYVSQYMLIGIRPISNQLVERKQYVPIAKQREFGVSWSNFVSIQNGLVPKDYKTSDFDQVNTRYPINGRDVATFVHGDIPGESFYNVVNILSNHGCPLAPSLPYANGSITNEESFLTMGITEAYSFVASVVREALKAAWVQKWRCHRRLRPEAMSGLVHRVKATTLNPYSLHSSLFAVHDGVDTLQLTYDRNATQSLVSIDPDQELSLSDAQTYLLGLVYPEGSPAHPSYPAGHAVLSGAASTVIKAIYDDKTLINTLFAPVKPNPADATTLIALSGEDENSMTVGGELDKLASNIAFARNFAGVHYRSDGDNGILLGEEVAIYFLQDQARMYAEEGFTGFELTKRNGQRIRITANSVTVIS